jgi:hypothetical protein
VDRKHRIRQVLALAPQRGSSTTRWLRHHIVAMAFQLDPRARRTHLREPDWVAPGNFYAVEYALARPVRPGASPESSGYTVRVCAVEHSLHEALAWVLVQLHDLLALRVLSGARALESTRLPPTPARAAAAYRLENHKAHRRRKGVAPCDTAA